MQINKVVNPGAMPIDGRQEQIYCKITLANGKLSISGVVGPMRNGNARGGCGQIDMEFKHKNQAHDSRGELVTPEQMQFTEGWNADTWYTFLDIWHVWHLNDMNPACEHQTAAGWIEKASELVTIYKWKLTREASQEQDEIQSAAMGELKAGNTVKLLPREIKILSLEYWIKTHTAQLPATIAEYYQKDGEEQKSLGWLDSKEHPDGILSRACDTCGYKYGSAWNKRAIPEEVIKFINALPATQRIPAWV